MALESEGPREGGESLVESRRKGLAVEGFKFTQQMHSHPERGLEALAEKDVEGLLRLATALGVYERVLPEEESDRGLVNTLRMVVAVRIVSLISPNIKPF